MHVSRDTILCVVAFHAEVVVSSVYGLLRTAEVAARAMPAKPKPRVPTEDDDCPVCLEPLLGSDLVYCRACGRPVHGCCHAKWASQAAGLERCVVCSAFWSAMRVV